MENTPHLEVPGLLALTVKLATHLSKRKGQEQYAETASWLESVLLLRGLMLISQSHTRAGTICQEMLSSAILQGNLAAMNLKLEQTSVTILNGCIVLEFELADRSWTSKLRRH